MKTLKELELASYKTGNYADYIPVSLDGKRTEVICCGWMEVHDDIHSLGSGRNPNFDVCPLYWHRFGVFVYEFEKNWYGITRENFINAEFPRGIKKSKNGFIFNATKLHAFVPSSVATRLIKDANYMNTAHYEKFVKVCEEEQTPKLVWAWGK
jgi:hypothetical protein